MPLSIFCTNNPFICYNIAFASFMSTISDYPSFSAANFTYGGSSDLIAARNDHVFFIRSTINCAENIENKVCHSLFLDEPANYYISLYRCAHLPLDEKRFYGFAFDACGVRWGACEETVKGNFVEQLIAFETLYFHFW